jgi:hypothetical protein
MTAALATLPFLATLWLLLVLGAGVLEESGAKIVAALKGELRQEQSARSAPPRLKMRPSTRIVRCASAEWRAAA